MRRSVEGRGLGWGPQSKQDGHYRDIQVLTRQGLSRRWVWGGLTGVEKIVVLDGER